MRSFVLVVLSALGLAGLFIAYWTMQPSHGGISRDPSSDMPVPPPPHVTGAGVLRPGQVVQLKQYDRNGQLISRFSADEYIPQRDGTIRVTHPIAEFFLANHQRVEVHGEDGYVVAKDVPRMAANAFNANTGPAAPPSRGRLNHVLLKLMDDVKKTTMLTMTTDNVVFDNETYRISTEGYQDSNGTMISDDQVPVFVTGQIEMQGRGMIIRWNDKDGRLELLEILHGDYLKITDRSGFLPGGSKHADGKSVSRRVSVDEPLGDGSSKRPISPMLVSTDESSASDVLKATSVSSAQPSRGNEAASSHTKSTAAIYQASFYDNVRVNQPAEGGQGDSVLIENVNRMDIDFLMKQGGGDAGAKSPAATQPQATAAQKEKPSVDQTAADGDERPGTSETASSTAPTPSTQPEPAKERPVYVYWTGVLRITPLKNSSPPVPLNAGDSSALLVGNPVTVHRSEAREQGGDEIKCATLLYQTAGEKVWLGKSDQFPQIQITKTPAAAAKEQTPTHLISAGTVQYSRADGKALMTGPGSAEVPLEPDQHEPHPQLHAAWDKQAEFDFTQGGEHGQPVVSKGRFEGDVDIRHPRFALRGQSLDLLFDPPVKSSGVAAASSQPTEKQTSQPNLRQVIATNDVRCQMDAGPSKKQNIDCNRLELDTDRSDGKLYARHVNATGSVHAWGDDDLRAQYVDLLLKPAPKLPAGVVPVKSSPDDEMARIELEKMVARDDVVAMSKDGSVAIGDELQVFTVDGKQKTILTSQTLATVTDAKGNIIKGPEIQFDSLSGRAHIVGAGSLHAIQQAPGTTQPSGQNMDVTWADEAIFDGAANRIDVNGRVLATSIDKRGYVDTAKGGHIRIDLRVKPTTQPVALAFNESSPRSEKGASKDAGGGVKIDPFKGKEISSLTIDNDATLASTLSAPNGDVLQQFEIAAPMIVVNEFGQDGSPSRTVTVPSAGRMLSRDHRPPQKSESPQGQTDSSGARGATAFEWSKKLVYVESAHRADMVGDVVVVHQDDDSVSLPVKLNCEHVIAWFEQTPKAASGSASTKPADQQPAMQLRYLTAEGGQVVIVRDVDQMIARQVDYDPKRHLLIATGTERNPVNFSNGATGGGTAEAVEWDTLTWKMKSKNAVFDYRPPTPPVGVPKNKKTTTKPVK